MTLSPAKANLMRRLPIIVILLAAVGGFLFLRDHLSFDALARNQEALTAFRDAHYLLAVAVFMVIYVVIVGCSLPGGTVTTLVGGFLFGIFPGGAFNVIAATLGAIVVFLAARAGLGADIARNIEARGGAAARLQSALRENEIPVLLMMRLVPALPFFLANLIPAFTGTKLSRFAATTFVGIIPGTLVFTAVGAGLSEVFAHGGAPDLGIIFTAPVLGPLVGLAALAALPMIIKALRGKES